MHHDTKDHQLTQGRCCACSADELEASKREAELGREQERFGWIIEAAEHIVVENKAGDELDAAADFLSAVFKAATDRARAPIGGVERKFELPRS